MGSNLGDTVLLMEDPQQIPREGKVIEIISYDDFRQPKAYKIRIDPGFRGAGSIVSAIAAKVFPKLASEEEEYQSYQNDNNMEHQHEQEHDVPQESTQEYTNETKAKRAAVFVLVALAVLASAYFALSGSDVEKELKIITDTRELNDINLLDSKDIQIRNDAQSRIDARAPRKSKLIDSIGYGKHP